LTNRLIGNASGLSNQQGGGMGEGWGDFHALLMTARPEDAAFGAGDWSGCYSVGGYALSPSSVGGGTYYFGVRRFPYSTDLAKNPMTFQHIQNSVALPSARRSTRTGARTPRSTTPARCGARCSGSATPRCSSTAAG
jgi:hypothetical protein